MKTYEKITLACRDCDVADPCLLVIPNDTIVRPAMCPFAKNVEEQASWATVDKNVCDHMREPGRHAFEFEYFPNRNIYNPVSPICKKCGKSIAELLGLDSSTNRDTDTEANGVD